MFKGRKIPSDFRLNIPPFSDIAAGLNWKLKCTVIIHKGKSVSHLLGRRIYPSQIALCFTPSETQSFFFNYCTYVTSKLLICCFQAYNQVIIFNGFQKLQQIVLLSQIKSKKFELIEIFNREQFV